MKTTLIILLALMAFMAVWSACQLDVVNTALVLVSMPFLIIGYTLLTTIENETEK